MLSAAERDGLLARLAHVRAAVAAAVAARRPAAAPDAPGDVRLLAASKRQPAAALCALYDAGVHDFAENYVQELVAKARALAATGRRPRWHLVGTLQRNKAALAASCADWVHALDDARLVHALARAATGRTAPLPVLLQLRLGPPAEGRGGCPPAGLVALAQAVLAEPTLRLAGLMGLPAREHPAEPSFAALAEHARALRRLPGAAGAGELSMGMSADFAAAIAQGATMVRIGTALFGPRPPPKASNA